MSAFKSLAPRLARRVRSARHAGEQAPAIAAPLPAPVATFTPTAHPTLRKTAPIRIGRHAGQEASRGHMVLPVRTPGPVPATPRPPAADDAALRRVRDGILGVSRADRFIADMRHTSGLPIFRKVAGGRGWCGLNEERPPESWSPLGAWHLEEREQDILHAIAAGTKTARIEVGDALEALRRQIATERGWRGTGMTA
jgi:hypothetical protein